VRCTGLNWPSENAGGSIHSPIWFGMNGFRSAQARKPGHMRWGTVCQRGFFAVALLALFLPQSLHGIDPAGAASGHEARA
jgi:hypothetical protein